MTNILARPGRGILPSAYPVWEACDYPDLPNCLCQTLLTREFDLQMFILSSTFAGILYSCSEIFCQIFIAAYLRYVCC